MIVVVGSLNMDLVVSAERMPQTGETLKGSKFAMVPGGKGANQAVGCAKLGADVTMFGAVGDDAFGKHIVDVLKENEVNVENIQIKTHISTGIASIFHTGSDNCIVIVPGANGELTCADLSAYEKALTTSKVMLAQLEIPLDVVVYALKEAKRHGVITILNPAPAAELPPEIYEYTDFITPNETELSILLKKRVENREDLERELIRWERAHPSKMIVTRGKDGCFYLDRQQLVNIRPPKIPVKDTTGAGDSFNSALAYALSQGWHFEKAVLFSVYASAISTMKFGAMNGMPSLEQVLDSGLRERWFLKP